MECIGGTHEGFNRDFVCALRSHALCHLSNRPSPSILQVGGVTRVNGNLNLSRAIGDLRYKGNSDVQRDAQVITPLLLLTQESIDELSSSSEVANFCPECLWACVRSGMQVRGLQFFVQLAATQSLHGGWHLQQIVRARVT